MIYFFKLLISLFLLSGWALANEQGSFFLFSKEKGIQPLSPSEEQTDNQNTENKDTSSSIDKRSIQALTSPTTKQKEISKNKNPVTPNKEPRNQIPDLSNVKQTTKQDHTPLLSSGQKAENPNQSVSSPENSSKEIGELDTPQNSISENFIPKTEETVESTNFLNTLSEDVSWFFQEKKTKHKIAFVPVYSYSLTQGSRLGLRFFSYSPEEKGYYLALSGSKYLFRPFSRWNISYIGNRKKAFRIESSLIYDNHYENYFGLGMEAELSDLKELYAHRLIANYSIFYQIPNQKFYLGLGGQLFFRKERPSYQKGKNYFEDELFLFFKGFTGYDSRDNWKNPETGAFHQLSFGCKSILAYPGAYCRGEGDLRFYLPLFKETDWHYSFKNSVLALRIFAGSSFFSKSTYSLAYSLGGINPFQNASSLRGFKQNRFRGDKIYFVQTEIRFPLWDKYIDGVLFAELGEVTGYKENFEAFVWDSGGGFRLGLPPNYDMKLRCDLGVGKDRQKKINYNFIISFLQAF